MRHELNTYNKVKKAEILGLKLIEEAIQHWQLFIIFLMMLGKTESSVSYTVNKHEAVHPVFRSNIRVICWKTG